MIADTLPPSPRILPVPLQGRRAAPLAPPSLDLHAWAEGWTLSSQRPELHMLELYRDNVDAARFAQRSEDRCAAGGTGLPGSGAPPSHRTIASSSSRTFGDLERASALTVQTDAFDGFKLDAAPGADYADGVYHRMRQNSLELDLGDFPKPLTILERQPYPSPASPSSTLFESAPTCYFDPSLVHVSASASSTPLREDLALPPSPALVPVTFSIRDAPFPLPPPPRAEASVAHPLHRAKRLSMTPLSSLSSALPAVEPCTPPVAEPPKLRKSSIVDLPLSRTACVATMPFSPPLTPTFGLVDLPPTMDAGRSASTKRRRQF